MSSDLIKKYNIHLSGNGLQPMLFAHGFGCDQKMWRYVTPAFELDYKIVLFDYIGAGKSDLSKYNTEKYASLQGYAHDILEICEELQLKNVVFVGHSVSCMIGLLAAIERPDYFSKLIMIGPSPCYINSENYYGGFEKQDIEELITTMEHNYIGWANFMAPGIMGRADEPQFGEELAESFCSTDPGIAREFAKATFFSDNRSDLAKLKVPSLILQCSSDIIAPLAVGNFVHLQMPSSTLKVMNAMGHCPHLSAPVETISLMKDYLLKEN